MGTLLQQLLKKRWKLVPASSAVSLLEQKRFVPQSRQLAGLLSSNSAATRLVLLLFFLLPFLLWVSVPLQAATMPPTAIDETQNSKAMGYTDSRKVVRDAQGNLYVAYRKKYKLHYETAYHIFVAKSTDNGLTWHVLNAAQPIETVGDFNQRVPAIAIDRADGLHVVWYGPDETTTNDDENQLKYVHSTDGGLTWSAWRNIAPVAGYQGQALWQEHPTIYVDNDNRIYVVWEGRDDWYTQSAQIKFTRSSDGGQSWTPWVNVAPSNHSHSRPALVVSGEQLYVFAYGNRGGLQQILYASSMDGGRAWSRWRQVAPSGQDQRHVAAAVDRTGRIHIVWRQPPFSAAAASRNNTQIYYAMYDGMTWRAPVHVGSHMGGAQTYPSIAVDAEQTVWITWVETTDPYDFPNDAPTTGAVYYVVKSELGWSAPLLYGGSGSNLYPSLRRNLTSGREQVDVVWLEALPTDYAIRFAQLARPTTFLPAAQQPEAVSPLVAAFTRIAWALDFDTAPLRAIQIDTLPQSTQWLRDLRAVLTLVAVVSLYVIAKFFMRRWLQVAFR